MKELMEKLELFSETRVGPKGDQESMVVRPIQFMKWWGDFRPGDRVDVDFGEDYIALAGTNAEGHFAGVKKNWILKMKLSMMEFISAEGNIWNFV
jgi:hypothetical protein